MENNFDENNFDKDLCKICAHYWKDILLTLDRVIPHCEILDKKKGLNANIDKDIPFPCMKCPFNSYKEIN